MTKKSFFKRALSKALLLTVGIILVLTSVACTGGASLYDGEGSSEPDVHVWTARSSERVLLQKYDQQTLNFNDNEKVDYSDHYGNTTLYINAFQNENEIGQIIISPTVDIKAYNLTIADLTCGTNVLSTDCFTIYNAKYMGVPAKEGNQGSGYYPDAMLYLDKAVEYGENHVEKGNHQTIYVSVKPAKGQAAGVYTGNFTVTADGVNYNVPVEVEVYDFELSDNPRVKYNLGAGVDNTAAGELDTTAEMEQIYYDFFASYRCFSGSVPGFPRTIYWTKNKYYNNDGTWADFILDWVAVAKKLTLDNSYNAYYIPYATNEIVINSKDTYTGADIQTKPSMVDPTYYAYQMKCMVENSFKNYNDKGGNTEIDANLFKKAESYFVYFDEFDSSSGKDKTAVASLKVVQYIQYRVRKFYIDKWYNGDESQLTEAENEILNGLLSVKHHCIGQKTTVLAGGNNYIINMEFTLAAGALSDSSEKVTLNLLDKAYAPAETRDATDKYGYPLYTPISECSFITTLNNYDSALRRSEYLDYAKSCTNTGGELWVYTAEHHGYASLHMEVPLLSERLQGWMMADWNVVGNLYWSGGLMRIYTKISGQYIDYIQDYFDTPERYVGTNGEGFLIYPGRQYEIVGPLPSIRLNSLRDGLEEADLLYDLRDYYQNRAIAKGEATDFNSFDTTGYRNILHLVTTELYSGSQIVDTNVMDSSTFQKARKMIAELLVMAKNTGAVIEDFDYSSGILTATVSAPEGVSVKADGKALTTIGTIAGITTYEYNVSLSEVGTSVTITAEKDGKSYSATLPSLQLDKSFDLGNHTASVLPTQVSKQVVNPGSLFESAETGDGTNGTLVGEKIIGAKFNKYEAFVGFYKDDLTALKNKNVTIAGFSFNGKTGTLKFRVTAPEAYTVKFGGETLTDGTAKSGNRLEYRVNVTRTYGEELPYLEVLVDSDPDNNIIARIEDKADSQNQSLNIDVTNEEIYGVCSAISVRIYVDKEETIKIAGVNESGSVTPCSETFDLSVGWNEVHVSMGEIGVTNDKKQLKHIRVQLTSVSDATVKVGRVYLLK